MKNLDKRDAKYGQISLKQISNHNSQGDYRTTNQVSNMSELNNDTGNITANNNISMQGNENDSDDVIPNAIVIKNIPFAIKKEQLLDIIDEMGLPLPYAFNYHFDNGIFRGLAFANFTTTEETMQVIDGLNGKDINGRKLKVEYKKLLPQHERDRIEREKREKRGQLEEQHRTMSNLSLQSLNRVISNTNSTSNQNNNNNNNGNTPLLNQFANNNNPQYNNDHPYSATSLNNYNNVHQSVSQQPLLVAQHTANSIYSSNNGYNNNNINNINSNNNNNTGSVYSANYNNNSGVVTERYYAPLPSSSNVPIPPQQLDFNDPDTLDIYSQMLLFKDRDKSFVELTYPMGLSANHKRIINVVCSFLNLVEVYDSRFVIIRRKNSSSNNSANVLDQTNLQNHLQQVQNNLNNIYGNGSNNNNSNTMLQPTSTGGSLNRSQSYTSLLQAHASTMSISLSQNNGNNNNNNNNNSSASNTPKLSNHPQLLNQQQPGVISSGSLLQQQSGSGSPNNLLNSLYNNNANGSGSSTDQIQHPQPVISQQLQSPQQQQQSFIRQQATLTPSSRVPSGYSNHHQSMNVGSNPLLRNAGNSSSSNNNTTSSGTPGGNTTTNATAGSNNGSNNRLLSQSVLYNNTSNSNLLASDQQMNPLVAQHTNGSIHSNFSIQSYHDDGTFNNNGTTTGSMLGGHNSSNNQNKSSSLMMNTNDLIYKTLSQSGALDNGDLDNHLARSLSGLDVQDNTTASVNGSKKNTIW